MLWEFFNGNGDVADLSAHLGTDCGEKPVDDFRVSVSHEFNRTLGKISDVPHDRKRS